MKPQTLDTLYDLIKPIIFELDLDPEKMHKIAFRQIERLDTKDIFVPTFDSLKVSLFGHEFSSPLLLAAGFDKEARITEKVPYLGFAGEVAGSFTALPSDGNKGKRLWRLVNEKAALNRMGLNNPGAYAAKEKLQPLEGKACFAVSIAKTNNPEISGDAAIEDYITSYNQLKDLGVFTELNISCPNTEDGRTFAEPSALKYLLAELEFAEKGKPLLEKLPPYLSYGKLKKIVEVSDNFVDGYACVNTKPYVHQKYGKGGISGLPLQSEALRTVRALREMTDKPIIGMGGIFTGKDALNLLQAGADLLEGFTGFIYRGPLYALRVAYELDQELKSRGLEHISQIRKYSK